MLQTKSRRKRTQVKRACTNCRKAHSACGHERPCPRCVARDEGHKCVDLPLKRRRITSSSSSGSVSPPTLRTNKKKRSLTKGSPYSTSSSLSSSSSEEEDTFDEVDNFQQQQRQQHGYNRHNKNKKARSFVHTGQEEEDEEQQKKQQQQQQQASNKLRKTPISHGRSPSFSSSTDDDETQTPPQLQLPQFNHQQHVDVYADTEEEEPKFYFADDLSSGCQSSPEQSSLPTSPSSSAEQSPYSLFSSPAPSSSQFIPSCSEPLLGSSAIFPSYPTDFCDYSVSSGDLLYGYFPPPFTQMPLSLSVSCSNNTTDDFGFNEGDWTSGALNSGPSKLEALFSSGRHTDLYGYDGCSIEVEDDVWL